MRKTEHGKEAEPIYHSYLVRLWRAESDNNWLASVEAAGTHERHSFPDLASLFAFLQAQTATHEEPSQKSLLLYQIEGDEGDER